MEIRWSDLALQAWQKAVDDLLEKWDGEVVLKFQAATIQWQKVLRNNPEAGQKEPLLENLPKEYRHAVVSQYNKLIYTIESDHIRIVDVWDTRREPIRQANRVRRLEKSNPL